MDARTEAFVVAVVARLLRGEKVAGYQLDADSIRQGGTSLLERGSVLDALERLSARYASGADGLVPGPTEDDIANDRILAHRGWIDQPVGGAPAPVDAPFVTYTSHAGLTDERVLTGEAGKTEIDLTVAGQAIVKLAAAVIYGVSSVFGRTGAVVAASSDYDASQVDNDSGAPGATVADALTDLDTRQDSAQATLLLHASGIADVTSDFNTHDAGTAAGEHDGGVGAHDHASAANGGSLAISVVTGLQAALDAKVLAVYGSWYGGVVALSSAADTTLALGVAAITAVGVTFVDANDTVEPGAHAAIDFEWSVTAISTAAANARWWVWLEEDPNTGVFAQVAGTQADAHVHTTGTAPLIASTIANGIIKATGAGYKYRLRARFSGAGGGVSTVAAGTRLRVKSVGVS